MITEVLMAILGGGVIGLVTGLGIGGSRGKDDKIVKLEKELKTEKRSAQYWYSEYSEGREEISECIERHNILVEMYNRLYLSNKENKGRQTSPKVGSVNKSDLVAAVRMAMMNSHPDKGGKAVDFIKYKEMYDEMRGK